MPMRRVCLIAALVATADALVVRETKPTITSKPPITSKPTITSQPSLMKLRGGATALDQITVGASALYYGSFGGMTGWRKRLG